MYKVNWQLSLAQRLENGETANRKPKVLVCYGSDYVATEAS